MSKTENFEHPWKDQAFPKLKKFEIQTLIGLLKDDRITRESSSQPPPSAYALYDDLMDTLEGALAIIERKTQPTVFDRLDEIDFVGDNIPLSGVESYSYSWSVSRHNPLAGAEKMDCNNLPAKGQKSRPGGRHYSGTYHPDVICETSRGTGGPGICKHCGRTLF